MDRGSLRQILDNKSIDLGWARKVGFARDAAAGTISVLENV